MCSNTFLPRAFARLDAFYFAPLASPSYLTFAVSPCLTWKTRRNWITGNDDLRTNGLSGDGISRRRGEARGEKKRSGEHGGAKCYRASTSARSIRRLTAFPFRKLSCPSATRRCRGARGRKLSYDVTATPPKSRSIWKRGETRRRPRNLHHHSRHPSSVAGAIPASGSTATVLLRSKR